MAGWWHPCDGRAWKMQEIIRPCSELWLLCLTFLWQSKNDVDQGREETSLCATSFLLTADGYVWLNPKQVHKFYVWGTPLDWSDRIFRIELIFSFDTSSLWISYRRCPLTNHSPVFENYLFLDKSAHYLRGTLLIWNRQWEEGLPTSPHVQTF